jgi:hypothetical protein
VVSEEKKKHIVVSLINTGRATFTKGSRTTSKRASYVNAKANESKRKLCTLRGLRVFGKRSRWMSLKYQRVEASRAWWWQGTIFLDEALFIAVSETVSKFLWEDVICRHSMFDKLIVDGGPENKGLVEGLVKKFGINRIITSAYHPEVNGMIERGYQSTANGLAKMTEGGLGKWVDNLPAVL